jgi:membrane protease YdiL (CAAX protease family)
VLAPICEELFFRGAIFGSGWAAGQTSAGAWISAVLFAIVHLSPILAPFYVFFALVMCWLLRKTRTLLAPMTAHFTMNAIACMAIVFQQGEIV